MKKILHVAAVLLASAPGLLYAQPNSVSLRNGAGTLLSQHTSITAAYTAIPATLTQSYTIETETAYTGASETYPILFTAKAGAGPANIITLRPALGVTAELIQTNIPSNGVLILDDADYVMIDGRPGGMGTARELTISNLATGSNANTIILRNGACFNQVKYVNVLNATTGSAGRGVFLSTAVSNPSGNSDNRFEHCLFPSGRYQFNISGTAANPNTRNTIFACDFQNMIFVGVWGQGGTGQLTIDSCRFYCNTASGDGLFFGILFDSQNDTVVISNNRMYDIQNGAAGTLRYIHIRSVVAGGNNYTDIHNNFLSMTTGNATHTNVGGIEYSDTDPIHARIAYNNIRIGGTLSSGGTSGSVGSSAFLLSSSGAGGEYEIRNNIFVNERSGGTTGLQHVALALTNTSGTFTMSDNTYNATSGILARRGTTTYADIPTYLAAVPGMESNTNDITVQFVSNTDLHLTGTSIGNPGLYAAPIAGITRDIDGALRSPLSPVRGADETTEPCSGTPDAGTTMLSADSVCTGDTVTVWVTGLTDAGLTFQWMASTDGFTYNDIVGATDTVYTGNYTQTTFFKCRVGCLLSGMSDTSAVAMLVVETAPSGGTITETHAGFIYSFNIAGLAAGAYTYAWNFGDGGTSTAPNPSHAFIANGAYNVTVIVSNDCGSDTLSYLTPVTVGMDDLSGNNAGILLYPNPAADGFTLAAQNNVQVNRIRITDVTGRIYYAHSGVTVLPAYFTTSQLQLSTGTYFVELSTHDETVNLRLVIK